MLASVGFEMAWVDLRVCCFWQTYELTIGERAAFRAVVGTRMEDELAARRIEDRSILSGEGVERAAARQCKVTIPPADCNRGQLMIGFVVMVIEYPTKVKVDVALHKQLE
jgi:hypothetical protein